MVAVRGGVGAFLLACACTAACGGDGSPGAVMVDRLDGGAVPDAGGTTDDAGASNDGSSSGPDGGTRADLDAGLDASGDSGQLVNSSDGSIVVAACTLEQNGIVVVSENHVSPNDPVAVAMRNDGALLAWSEYLSGKQRLFDLVFTPDSTATSTTVTPAPGPAQVEPAVAATSSGYLAVWSDQTTGHFNINSMALDNVGTPDATQSSLDSNQTDEHTPAIAVGADGNAVVVYRLATPNSPARTLLIGADGTPRSAIFSELPEYTGGNGGPAIAKFLTGYLVAWIDDTAARHVHMQKLDAGGAPLGSSFVVDAEGSAQAKLDIATTDTGGAVTWDVFVAGARPEVRFRAFDATGALTGIEHVVSNAPDQGLWPSMVPLRGGYAIAYRSAVPNNFHLELALLDRFGGIIAAKTIAPLVDDNLPVALRVSPDGQHLFLAWTDTVGQTTAYQLQRAWIHCD